jgi:hypothetical protein
MVRSLVDQWTAPMAFIKAVTVMEIGALKQLQIAPRKFATRRRHHRGEYSEYRSYTIRNPIK